MSSKKESLVLPKKDKLKVLYQTRTTLIEDKSELPTTCFGICIPLSQALEQLLDVPNVDMDCIKDYVPEFTIKKVTNLCKKNGLTPPVDGAKIGNWWWKGDDYDSRINYLTALIAKLEDK